MLVSLAVVASLALLSPGLQSEAVAATDNPVKAENSQTGTDNWRISLQPSDDLNNQIKGYASSTSVNVGSTIQLYVTTNPSQRYDLEIYRMGYYQGLGGRLMRRVTRLDGVRQSACPVDSATGMVSCAWSSSYSLDVPTTWTSGIYLAKLTNAAGYQNYINFVVRDDSRPADFLYQESVTTYQAYNNYPNDVPAGAPSNAHPQTGKSLYEYNSSDSPTGAGTTRAVKVSFDRPYSNDDGAGDFLDWELYYVRWMEENGYNVAYSTDLDTHAASGRLLNYRAFLSVGHDEYWSKEMLDGVTQARNSGVNLGFFGANSAYWQVRFEQSSQGARDRVMVCYKNASLDPVTGPTTTVRWRDPQVNRPEQTLIGIMSTGQQPSGAAPATYVAKNSDNWVYDGTGVANGDRISSIVGYETDRAVNSYPAPTVVPGSYTLLSSSPYSTSDTTTDYANSSIYQAGSGAWVFAAGSIEWSWGLTNYGNYQYADPRVQRITSNVLDRFIAPADPPPAAPTGLSATPASSSAVDLSWTDNATNETGYVLDRSDSPTFDSYTSVALGADVQSFHDSVPQPDVYYYRVRSVGAATNSPYSPAASVSTISYHEVVQSTSTLLAHWRLGETSGTLAADSSPGKYDGRYQNGPTLGADGAVARDPNGSVALNGSNNKVSLPSLPPVTDFALEGWTYLTSGSAPNSAMYGSDGNVRLLVRPGGGGASLALASVWLGGTEYSLQPSGNKSNLNSWVHWVLSRSGSTLTLYQNGVAVGRRSDLPADATANVSGWIGAQGGSAYYFSGRIDDVSVYNSSLSSGQVARHYAAGLNGVSPPRPPDPPAAPNGLTAAPRSSTRVDLAWTDNSTNESDYVVERSASAAFDTTTQISLPADSTSYTDTVASGGVYYYRVKAINAAGPSPFSATSAAATTSYDQLISSRTSAVARWRLGEASGTTAVDSVGSNDGQYVNGVTLGAPGAIARDPNTSASFNGTNNKVSLGAVPAVTDFTVEGWSNLASASTNSALYGTSGNVRILVRSGGGASSALASVWVGGTEYALQPTTSESNVGTWVDWALTRAGNVLTLYRNGKQVAQRSDLPPTGTANLTGWIGAQGGNAYYLAGRVDEVSINGSAASASQISDAYVGATNGLAPPPPPAPTASYRDVVSSTPGLMSYYRLGEAAGTVAKDSQGSADGTYSNGVTLGAPGAVTNDTNTAAGFNGSTAKVKLPDVTPVVDFSIEGWSYLTSSAANSALYGTLGNARILVRPGGSTGTSAYAGVWLDGTEYVLQPTTAESNLNTWVHWVLTRSGSTLTLYRNGVQVGQRTNLPASSPANLSGWIGAQGGNAYYFTGKIDDVSIYGTALTRNAVKNHYDAAILGPTP